MCARSGWMLVLALAACHASDAAQSEPPDAAVHELPQPTCNFVYADATCSAAAARTGVTFHGVNAGTHSLCNAPFSWNAQCAMGCAVQFEDYSFDFGAIMSLASHPAVLCAETPEAKAGDPCHPLGTVFGFSDHTKLDSAIPCLPTRAQIAAHGSVAGQNYLACNAAGSCEPTAPPLVEHYLDACSADVLARYGVPGVHRAVSSGQFPPMCLLAWDDAAGAVRSGMTIPCLGDWECPRGALCDDQIPDAMAMCKPGPRGALTAAMLLH